MNPGLLLADEDGFMDEFRFKADVPLPQSLTQCRQTVFQDQVRITHCLQIDIHVSGHNGATEIVKSHDVLIF